MRRLSTLTAVATALTAVTALAAGRKARPATLVGAEPTEVLPAQRRPLLREVLTGDADLLLAEQDACDAHVLDVLEVLVRRAGSSAGRLVG